MQITTATGRVVEILADTPAYVTYRNVRDGAAYGPSRLAKPDAKFGSVGREILEALSAHKAAEDKLMNDFIADVAAELEETLPVTVLGLAPASGTLNGTQVAQLLVQLAADWTEARVAGQDDLLNDRVGTVLARSFQLSDGGRPYVLVSWDEDEGRDLRRRYASAFLEDLRQL